MFRCTSMSESSASTSPTKYAPPSPRKIRPRGKLTRTNPATLAATAHAAVKTNASFTVHATSASPRAASSVVKPDRPFSPSIMLIELATPATATTVRANERAGIARR